MSQSKPQNLVLAPSAPSAVRRRASIHDVAQRAGVSIKTVSRVLNREPNVSEATRSRVMAAVADLSYRPNMFARGLASVKSFLIGLLYDNPSASYVAGLQLGAIKQCREDGYHLIVEMVNSKDPKVGEAVLALVTESNLHGVILTPPVCDNPEVLAALESVGMPYVSIAPASPESSAAYVAIDDRLAAYEMTSYLVKLGHRRIGFIKGDPSHGAASARLQGYCDALSDAGISYDEGIVAQGMFSYQSGLEAAEKLLSLPERPTAIFAANDDMAAAVLATSQKFNLRTPEQLSIAGFDDSEVSHVVWPQLTTCKQPISEMAAEAVSLLIQGGGGSGAGGRDPARLGHTLVLRNSTAPPER